MIAVALLTAFGCAGYRSANRTPPQRLQLAEDIASASGFVRLAATAELKDGRLPVAAWIRSATPASTAATGRLRIYIEGDGLAWQSRRIYSLDPTPLSPTGLRLAAADQTTTTVLYLARPCQFVSADATQCRPIHWTAGRFSETVIDSMNERIETILRRLDFEAEIELIGYSGGGVVAALLAARRDDVDWLVTIAAPLDVAGWTRRTRVSPLVGSLSPMDEIESLRQIRQHHFAGDRDRRVPAVVTEAYHDALGPAANSRMTIVPGLGHAAWPEAWPSLLMASATDQTSAP